MFRALLKSKIHRVTATPCDLPYQGSCAIDENLLDAAGIVEHEQIHIWNIANDERFVTYAMKGKRGTGMVSVNGSAVRGAAVGDVVIIATIAQAPEQEVNGFQPKLIFAHEVNQRHSSRNFVPTPLV